MREYEIVAFIQERQGSEDPQKDAVNVVSEVLKQQGAAATKLDGLGRRSMGYRVNGQREAQWVLSHCRMEAGAVEKVDRALRLHTQVLTFMITSKKPEVAVPLHVGTEARPVKKPLRGRTRV